MGFYRITLELEGPQGTRLHSGTLFGHLCWAWRDLRGEEALVRWLATLPEQRFELSDGMPAGYLPTPLLRPAPRRDRGGDQAAARAVDEKQLRKRSWISLAGFLAIRGHASRRSVAAQLAKEEPPPLAEARRIAHNTIDRRTGRTPESAGLFFVEEEWPDPRTSRRWDVYVSTDLSSGWLGELFAHVGRMGFGRDATAGRGRFRAEAAAAPAGLFDGQGERRLSLSHGSLSANMVEPFYRLETHYGKTAALLGTALSPFKYPLTLLRPGATFTAEGDGPFGALLYGVHPQRPEVVHNAWHLTVPFTEEETDD
jgi:CRISPR-associated protein Csm4